MNVTHAILYLKTTMSKVLQIPNIMGIYIQGEIRQNYSLEKKYRDNTGEYTVRISISHNPMLVSEKAIRNAKKRKDGK